MVQQLGLCFLDNSEIWGQSPSCIDSKWDVPFDFIKNMRQSCKFKGGFQLSLLQPRTSSNSFAPWGAACKEWGCCMALQLLCPVITAALTAPRPWGWHCWHRNGGPMEGKDCCKHYQVHLLQEQDVMMVMMFVRQFVKKRWYLLIIS